MQKQNRKAVFGFAVRNSEKVPLFVQAQSGDFFRVLILHLFPIVLISSFTGRRPDHMRGQKSRLHIGKYGIYHRVIILSIHRRYNTRHVLRPAACEGGCSTAPGKAGTELKKDGLPCLHEGADLFQ